MMNKVENFNMFKSNFVFYFMLIGVMVLGMSMTPGVAYSQINSVTETDIADGVMAGGAYDVRGLLTEMDLEGEDYVNTRRFKLWLDCNGRPVMQNTRGCCYVVFIRVIHFPKMNPPQWWASVQVVNVGTNEIERIGTMHSENLVETIGFATEAMNGNGAGFGVGQ